MKYQTTENENLRTRNAHLENFLVKMYNYLKTGKTISKDSEAYYEIETMVGYSKEKQNEY